MFWVAFPVSSSVSPIFMLVSYSFAEITLIVAKSFFGIEIILVGTESLSTICLLCLYYLHRYVMHLHF